MFIAIAVIVTLVLVVLAGRRGTISVTRRCRWKADPSGDHGRMRKYECSVCKAEAFTATKGPPQGCKDRNRSRGL